jgi:predicted transcriptional regulator
MASKTVSVRLKSETLEKLGAMAEAMHRPRAWLMAHAIERYIEHEAWQVAAIQTAVDELDKGQADLVDHATVVQWLDRWGAEGEVEPPSCR